MVNLNHPHGGRLVRVLVNCRHDQWSSLLYRRVVILVDILVVIQASLSLCAAWDAEAAGDKVCPQPLTRRLQRQAKGLQVRAY